MEKEITKEITMEDLMKKTGLSKEQLEKEINEFQILLLKHSKEKAKWEHAKKIRRKDLLIIGMFATVSAFFVVNLRYHHDALIYNLLAFGAVFYLYRLNRKREKLATKHLEEGLQLADQLLKKFMDKKEAK